MVHDSFYDGVMEFLFVLFECWKALYVILSLPQASRMQNKSITFENWLHKFRWLNPWLLQFSFYFVFIGRIFMFKTMKFEYYIGEKVYSFSLFLIPHILLLCSINSIYFSRESNWHTFYHNSVPFSKCRLIQFWSSHMMWCLMYRNIHNYCRDKSLSFNLTKSCILWPWSNFLIKKKPIVCYPNQHYFILNIQHI